MGAALNDSAGLEKVREPPLCTRWKHPDIRYDSPTSVPAQAPGSRDLRANLKDRRLGSHRVAVLDTQSNDDGAAGQYPPIEKRPAWILQA